MNKFFILLLALASGVMATSWYVDNTAEGTNAGTSWANAWESFASIAWESISAGDTLYISGGSTSKTYSEGLTIDKSGSSGNRVLITNGVDAGHTGTVIIDGNGYDVNYGIVINGDSYINLMASGQYKIRIRKADYGIYINGSVTNLKIKNLEVDSNGNSSDCHGIAGSVAYSTDYGIEICSCYVHDNYQDAINIVQSSAGEGAQFGTFLVHHNTLSNVNDDGMETALAVDFYNNEIGPRIYSGGRGHPDGVQFYNSYSRIYNNYFHGFVIETDPTNSNSNIFFDPFDADITLSPKYVYIYNNVIVEPATAGADDVHRGIAVKLAETGVTGGHDIIVCNNTLYHTPYYALSFSTGSLAAAAVYNIKIENNCFVDIGSENPVFMALSNGNGTITYGSHGDDVCVVVDYNSVYASSGTYTTDVDFNGVLSYSNFKTTTGCQDHDVTSNPALQGDYTILESSQLCNAAVSLSTLYTTDKNGTARPQGAAWDVGAYEVISQSVVKIIMRIR